MTRFEALLTIYSHLDTINTGLILLAVWAATSGHLVDWITVRGWRVLIPIYWSLVVIAYSAGIIRIGLSYS
ncbi:MAG: hypothetical protein IMZ50_02755 [Candidatus Atribacteria bacterium]|nr:hypothetical protein [Candidatus Atribacteria bacterium]